MIACASSIVIQFQSTPPARGATCWNSICLCWQIYFNPRPPRGGRLSFPSLLDLVHQFQSTPPARGATFVRHCWDATTAISIHAPREGGDGKAAPGTAQCRNFNPRPPRGGRPNTPPCGGIDFAFQSTPPARGATFHITKTDSRTTFQSTPPARGATETAQKPKTTCQISIHAPREGGDSKDAQFYLRIFDKQVELLRFLGKIRGGCLRNPEKDRRFLGKSLANLPEISGHLDFAGGGKAHPGYPCAVPLLRRAACVRGSGDPPADRCSSYRNAPLFSHIASPDSRSADCLSQNP